MSTESNSNLKQPTPIDSLLSIKELGGVLVKHYGFHVGLFEVMVEFQIGMGPVGPNPESLSPGAMIGISRIGLLPTQTDGPTTINAAKVNPKAKKSSVLIEKSEMGRTTSTSKKKTRIEPK